jgi:threonine aldolase
MEINLISDTVTKTNEMLQYMFNAEVEMMSIGKTQQLYKEAALFGMEAGLFFPSGIMANQTAIKVNTQASN